MGIGEPDPLPLAMNRHIQPNHLSPHVDERPAAAAHVDRRVGLQPVRNLQWFIFTRRPAAFRT
jgi:phosphoribulokinase